jgi:hypothetical protein
MSWIESHQSLGQHPKTIRLASLLKVSMPAAVGHLHYLWWWTMDYAPDGKIGRYDAGIIGHACLWKGKPQALVDALVEAGFLDADGDLMIHDWPDYAGRLIERRESNKDRQKAFRDRRKTGRDAEIANGQNNAVGHTDNAARNGDVGVTERARVALPTVPTVPTLTNLPTDAAVAASRAHVSATPAHAREELPEEVRLRLRHAPIDIGRRQQQQCSDSFIETTGVG